MNCCWTTLNFSPRDIHGKKTIKYGDPGGGQRQNECGYLVVKWILQHLGIQHPNEHRMKEIAADLAHKERQLRRTQKSYRTQYYSAMGDYNITALQEILRL